MPSTWVHCSCIARFAFEKSSAVLLQCKPGGIGAQSSVCLISEELCVLLIAKIMIMCFLRNQLAQLLTCDWLLEARTSLWESDNEKFQSQCGEYVPVSGAVLAKFQKDLNSLRIVTNQIPVICVPPISPIQWLLILFKP